MRIRDVKKLDEARSESRVYCKCGHSMNIYPFEHIVKKICSHCGHYVYINELEEFKDKMRKELKK